jgi:hypothetical protein
MMKVKTFYIGPVTKDDLNNPKEDEQINLWLSKLKETKNVEIVSILQSSTHEYTTITIWYVEN